MYKQMTKEDFVTSVSDFDITKLPNTEVQEYLNLSTLYRTLLNEYIKQLGLGSYEEAIKNSGLNFVPIQLSEQDFYQYYNNCELTYYYIRNNIYLNRLTEEEYNYLKEKSKSQDYALNNVDITFLSNTFRKVIPEIHENVEEPFITNFGPIDGNFFAENRAIVIGFRYNKLYENDIDSQSFATNYERQKDFYLSLNGQLESELQQKLNMPVKVIEYDESSIIKINKSKEKYTKI